MLLVCITPAIKAGPADPKIPTGLAGIADLLGVLEHFKFALNVAFFVRHEYFLHPKPGNLQKVSRESVHIYKYKLKNARTGGIGLNGWPQRLNAKAFVPGVLL